MKKPPVPTYNWGSMLKFRTTNPADTHKDVMPQIQHHNEPKQNQQYKNRKKKTSNNINQIRIKVGKRLRKWVLSQNSSLDKSIRVVHDIVTHHCLILFNKAPTRFF